MQENNDNFQYTPKGIMKAIKFKLLKLITTMLLGVIIIMGVLDYNNPKGDRIIVIYLFLGIVVMIAKIYFEAKATAQVVDSQSSLRKLSVKHYI